MQEALGAAQEIAEFSFLDLALQKRESISIISMSGHVNVALDISKDSSLEPFLEVIQNFGIPRELVLWAKRLGVRPPHVVDSMEKLRLELAFENWRGYPALLSIPSNSQQFGEIARAAGIEAIIYRSAKTGKLCLAAFPDNFANSDSFLRLDDDPPAVTPPTITRLDRNSWQDLR